MHTVQQILSEKNNKIWSIQPSEMVFEAIKLMAEHGIGALLVTQDEKLVGVISERDYTAKVILQDRSSKTTPVNDIMTSNLISVSHDNSIDDCLDLMAKHHIRHLPVVQDQQIVGILSIKDLLLTVISEKEYLIKELEQYINS